MSTIRPNPFAAQLQPSPQRADAARTAAQRAFFQAAVGQAAAPAPSATINSPVQTVRAARIPEPGAAEPAKPLRPGSLLDIRV